MNKGRVAEWVLSLVTSPERAAAVVGDLEEKRSGPFGFWSGIARITGSLLWHGFAAEWPRMLALGALGMFIQTFLTVAAIVLFAFVTGLFIDGLGGLLLRPSASPPQMLVSQPVVEWIGHCLGFVIYLCAQFTAGRQIARPAPGRELAPCIGVLLLEYAISFVLYLIWPSGLSTIVLGIPMGVLSQIPLFAGAASVRRRSWQASSGRT